MRQKQEKKKADAAAAGGGKWAADRTEAGTRGPGGHSHVDPSPETWRGNLVKAHFNQNVKNSFFWIPVAREIQWKG